MAKTFGGKPDLGPQNQKPESRTRWGGRREGVDMGGAACACFPAPVPWGSAFLKQGILSTWNNPHAAMENVKIRTRTGRKPSSEVGR